LTAAACYDVIILLLTCCCCHAAITQRNRQTDRQTDSLLPRSAELTRGKKQKLLQVQTY